MNEIIDYMIILKIKAGDTDAWEELVQKYYETIFKYCLRRFFWNVPLAEDLTQDIFLKVISSIHKYKMSGKFFNFLFTIAVNTCHNYAKKGKFEVSELDETRLADEYRETGTVYNAAIQDELQDALNQLPEFQKDAIILKYYHALKVKDIARISDVSVATAQSRINQGLKKLKKLLNREDFYIG